MRTAFDTRRYRMLKYLPFRQGLNDGQMVSARVAISSWRTKSDVQRNSDRKAMGTISGSRRKFGFIPFIKLAHLNCVRNSSSTLNA